MKIKLPVTEIDPDMITGFMIDRFKDTEFSLALGIGLLTLALFVYWLRTGGRKPR